MVLNPYNRQFKIIGWLLIIYLIIGFVTRGLLLLSTTSSHISASQLPGIFLIGLVYDLAIGSCILIPFILLLWFKNEWVYDKPRFWIISLTLIVVLLAAIYFNWLPKEFNGALYEILLVYLWFRIGVFILLGILGKKIRVVWRKVVLYFLTSLTIFLMVFNLISEYFFWEEFSARYNFIAVDYLVYTNEVLGNIRESYPVGWLIAACLVISVTICILLRKKIESSITDYARFSRRTIFAILLISLPLLLLSFLNNHTRQFSKNEYANELAGNGIYQFGYAFMHNELDYQKYYISVPPQQAYSTVRKALNAPHNLNFANEGITRNIVAEGNPNNFNIVLISVESLSASFMKSFGNTKNITPQLDSLAEKSWFFNNLYATGTRTVRGLEALSMGIPPTPGQSIVKRPNNKGLYTIGNVLRSRGYITQYLYGGYSYFDNMHNYFSNNGYDVIDRTAIPQNEIHYQNIWGVADEDLFTLALKTFDKNAATGKPFFSQIMTVSNHRPYTYPENRIDIPPSKQSREGAVKYTDYAIGRFLREAQLHSWFNNTIFVVVADHCAHSAGSVDLPVTGYHIPMLIYAPLLIQPKIENTLTSQIDIPPTLLGLLNISYQSKFFGEDIRKADSANRRVFISTYQGLGYLTRDTLAILWPVRNVKCFKPDMQSGLVTEVPINNTIVNEAVSFYEAAANAYKTGAQKYDTLLKEK